MMERREKTMVPISRETLSWIRIHINKFNASDRAVAETIIEIDAALSGPRVVYIPTVAKDQPNDR